MEKRKYLIKTLFDEQPRYKDMEAGCIDGMSKSWKLISRVSIKKLVEDGTLIRIGAGRKTQYARG